MSKYRGKNHDGPEHASPYPLSRLAPSYELVSMAEEIAKADTMLHAVVGAELAAIARQIRSLQQQARDALERAQRDAALHRAECRFRKQPGRTYHLYRGQGDRLYFSLLSPSDWRGEPPHPFEGSYRLEPDMRWTPVAQPARSALPRAPGD